MALDAIMYTVERSVQMLERTPLLTSPTVLARPECEVFGLKSVTKPFGPCPQSRA